MEYVYVNRKYRILNQRDLLKCSIGKAYKLMNDTSLNAEAIKDAYELHNLLEELYARRYKHGVLKGA